MWQVIGGDAWLVFIGFIMGFTPLVILLLHGGIRFLYQNDSLTTELQNTRRALNFSIRSVEVMSGTKVTHNDVRELYDGIRERQGGVIK